MENASEKYVDDTGFEDIRKNYEKIVLNIAEACDKAGRKNDVRIMAVTKTVPTENINFAESLGINLLGENRVQEFLGKYENYSKNSEIHFIGGLQNNKVKYIIDKVGMIHSVDNEKLMREINSRAEKCGKVMDILIEVNAALEESKGGISPESLSELLLISEELSFIKVRGLMTIPPPEMGEKYFPLVQELYEKEKDRYGFDTLSMGMSGDYAEAVKFGSNIVRIGSGLFGYRKYY